MTNEEAIKLLSQIKDALLASNSWLPSTDNPIKESFGMAINALTAQSDIPIVDTPTVVPTCEDTISRQDAIRIVDGIDTWQAGWRGDAIESMKALPSAQPVAKDINVPINDCISRQAAIDAILAVTGNSSVRELYEHVQEHGLSDMWSGGVNAAIDIIIAVPSAQPELIEREAYIRGFEQGKTQGRLDTLSAQPDLSEYSDKLWKAAYERGKAEAQPDLDEVYAHAETEAEARFHAQIVRCKDCAKREYCRTSTAWAVAPSDNWYCADAERRTDDTD